jgi:hypothetical protein
MSTKLGEKLVPLLGDMFEKLEAVGGSFMKKENQQKVQDWISAFKTMGDRLSDIASAAGAVASAFGKLFGPLESAWNALPEWLRNWIKAGMPLVPGMGKVQSPGGRSMLAVVPAPATFGGTPRSIAGSSSGSGLTIIVQGAIDPEATARQIRSILSGHDARQGRAPGQALARAW